MKKKLNLEIRKQIEELLNRNFTVQQISKELSIFASSVYRELKKCDGKYNADEADNKTSKGYHPIDLSIIGKKYGNLLILEYCNRKSNHRTFWKALCDCGAITYISRKKLGDYCSPDRPLSCGCVAKENKGSAGKVPIEEAALRKYQDLLTFKEVQGRCWNWTGYMQKNQVPKTSWKNIAMSVRKCMFLIINGSTYESEPVYATCRNRLCFNPEHIALGRPPTRNWYDN
jgi:hypothetical protein